jgi:hypothetical protein
MLTAVVASCAPIAVVVAAATSNLDHNIARLHVYAYKHAMRHLTVIVQNSTELCFNLHHFQTSPLFQVRYYKS